MRVSGRAQWGRGAVDWGGEGGHWSHLPPVTLILGGLSLQLLEARPSERLRPGHGGGSSRPYPLDPVVRDKGPGPRALQKRISAKMEGSVASIAFIKRGNSTVRLGRHTRRLRESESLSRILRKFELLLLQEGGPLQGPKLGSYLALGSELSEETPALTKQEILLGKGARVESSRARESRRTALPCGSQYWVFW